MVESLVRITQERHIHIRRRTRILDFSACNCALKHLARLHLRNLIDREVRSVRCAGQPWLERRSDASEGIEINTSKERMLLNLRRSVSSKSVLGVADERANKVLSLSTELDVIREMQGLTPVDDLAVSIILLLGAEGWPADLAFEHDRAEGPEVAVVAVSVSLKDLRGNVIWCSDRGVSHQATGFSPVVDHGAVGDCHVDLLEVDGHAVFGFRRSGLGVKQRGVVGVVVEFLETGGEAEVG